MASEMTAHAETGSAPTEDIFSPRVQRRNFAALIGDYVFFGAALNLINPSGMAPDFVARLGGGPVLVGLAGLIFRIMWLVPQLAFAPWVNRAPRKKNYIIVPAIPARLAFLPVSALMVLIGTSSPGLLITVFLSGYALLAFGDGLSVVGWLDVLGSSVKDEYRVWMFGVGQAVSGITVVLVVAPAVRYILGPNGPVFPNNYATLLAIAAVLLLVALYSFSRLKEGKSDPPEDSPDLREFSTFLGRILREDAMFRGYLLMRFVVDLSAIAMPFYIVFATEKLGQESAIALSDQILLVTLTGILAALVMGRINQRSGSRIITIIAGCVSLLSPLLILSSTHIGIIGLHLMWISRGILDATFLPGFLNWVVEYAPEGYRPIYGGLSNTFGALAMLAPLVGGLIVTAFSYDVLFVVAAELGGLAMVLAIRLPEPRAIRRQREMAAAD